MTRAATRAAGSALADKLGARAAGLAAHPGTMPAETKPEPKFRARISHTTTPGQLEALEALRTAEKAAGDGAVSITALLRAATALCLDDAKLRARWIKLARSDEWR